MSWARSPLADSMENAQRMVDASKEKGKIYSVIQNRRYDPNIRRLKSLLSSGQLGNIAQSQLRLLSGTAFRWFP